MEAENDQKAKSKVNCKKLAGFREEDELLRKTKFAIENSNEEMMSEVSNPVMRSEENASGYQDVSSQPLELAGSKAVCSSKATPTTSGNSSSFEIKSEEDEVSTSNEDTLTHEPQNDTDFSESRVVLEIPEHARSSGIKKITFKFRKLKRKQRIESLIGSDTELVPSGISDHHLRSETHVMNRNYSRVYSRRGFSEVRNDDPRAPQEDDDVISPADKFMSTGILNGARVKYISHFPEHLSDSEFELHAGTKTRHPNSQIYLENGKSIDDAIRELKNSPCHLMEEVMNNDELFQVSQAGCVKSDDNYGQHEESHDKQPYLSHSFAKTSSFISNMAHQEKRITKGYYRRRDNDLHRLLFASNGLPDGAELAYRIKGQKMLGGYKQGNGILCCCCDIVISPSQFEAHAGKAARRQPYRHIYASNGLTLHEIAIGMANGKQFIIPERDNACTECGIGGSLIMCGSCSQAFHRACMNLSKFVEGSWFCSSCYLGNGGNGMGPNGIQLTQVVEAQQYDFGGCVVCRSRDFSAGPFDDQTIIICDQCEKEFHVGCLRSTGMCDLKGIPQENWYCCNDCQNIHIGLHNLVSRGVQMISPSQFEVILKKHDDKGLFVDGAATDVQWRILMSKSREPEHLMFLSQAAVIFRECFDPIVTNNGRDLIPLMVYGRNISGQEFGGMYCVILNVKDIVVSAGIFRIFGKEIAELPLIATRREYQGMGFLRTLFSCIENLLCSMNVKNLVLPASEEAELIWTRKFAFRKMRDDLLSKFAREFQLIIFKGTTMLEKEILRINS